MWQRLIYLLQPILLRGNHWQLCLRVIASAITRDSAEYLRLFPRMNLTSGKMNCEVELLAEPSKRHTCCCGTVHVKRCTLYIAVYHVLVIFLIFTWRLFSQQETVDRELMQTAILFIEIIVIFYLIKAICDENRILLLPYIVLQLFGLLIGVTAVVISTVLLSTDSQQAAQFRQFLIRRTNSSEIMAFASDTNHLVTKLILGIMDALGIISSLLAIFSVYTVAKCYAYFQEVDSRMMVTKRSQLIIPWQMGETLKICGNFQQRNIKIFGKKSAHQCRTITSCTIRIFHRICNIEMKPV